MSMNRWFSCLIVLYFLFQGCAAIPEETEVQATPQPMLESLETGYLEATPGYVGDLLGAEVTDTNTSGKQIDVIDITIPVDPDQVDEIRVISANGKVVKQNKPAEVIPDYRNNNVGIRLFLPKQKNWEFKLRLVDLPTEK